MRLTRRVLRAVCALAFIACAGAQAADPAPSSPSPEVARSADEQRLVGTWYGEFTPGGNAPMQRFITTRKADGTFSLRARMYQGSKMVAEARNSGLWGISNGMYFTVTTEVNGTRSDPKLPEAINAYLVQTLKPDWFQYVHFASGRQFVVVRVDADKARLPD